MHQLCFTVLTFFEGKQAGVQAPILGASVPGVPAGDFEAEFRGALEHAHSVALHALHAALASGKVCFLDLQN